MIDMRCGAGEPAPRHRGAPGRCQLAAGHEGDHAVMFCRAGTRMVRVWAALAGAREHVAGQENRPWAPGMPTPAWDEGLLQAVRPAPEGSDLVASSDRAARLVEAS